MADFWFDPLKAAGYMMLGGGTDLLVPSAAGLTLAGLAPSLNFQLAVPSGRTNASASGGRPHVSGAPPAGSWVWLLQDSVAHGSQGNEWSIAISKQLSGIDGIEVRVGEVADSSATPVWTVAAQWIGVAIRGNPTTVTVNDFIAALAAVGVSTSVGGVAGTDLLTGTSVNTHPFTGGTSNLTFTRNTPTLNKQLAGQAPTGLTLTGQAPTLTTQLAIPSATGLVLTGLQPSLNIFEPADNRNTLIGPVVGSRIGLQIDPKVGG